MKNKILCSALLCLSALIPCKTSAGVNKTADDIYFRAVRAVNKECKGDIPDKSQYDKCKKGRFFLAKRIRVNLPYNSDEIKCEDLKNVMEQIRNRYEKYHDLHISTIPNNYFTCPGIASPHKDTVILKLVFQ